MKTLIRLLGRLSESSLCAQVILQEMLCLGFNAFFRIALVYLRLISMSGCLQNCNKHQNLFELSKHLRGKFSGYLRVFLKVPWIISNVLKSNKDMLFIWLFFTICLYINIFIMALNIYQCNLQGFIRGPPIHPHPPAHPPPRPQHRFKRYLTFKATRLDSVITEETNI